MPVEKSSLDFSAFARWVATRQGVAPEAREPPERIVAAARVARDETLATMQSARAAPSTLRTAGAALQVLELLAAASTNTNAQPPELMTSKGFRVTLAYDEGTGDDRSSICVLVRCPPDLIGQVQGGTAYLWNGAARFELGQFDADGKAIGTLPAGIEITLADFATGNVQLEAPVSPD